MYAIRSYYDHGQRGADALTHLGAVGDDANPARKQISERAPI